MKVRCEELGVAGFESCRSSFIVVHKEHTHHNARHTKERSNWCKWERVSLAKKKHWQGNAVYVNECTFEHFIKNPNKYYMNIIHKSLENSIW